MMKTKTMLIAMVWLSILFIWGANKIDSAIRGRPIPSTITPVGTLGIDGSVNVNVNSYAVPMGNNTVWIITPNYHQIQIITHDGKGYHSKVVEIDASP
jgi:hypothetical protein